MNQYRARDILALSEEQVWQLEEGPIILHFDGDETIKTTGKETIISSYIWDIHRRYPQTPLMARHHLNGERFSGGSHLNLLSNAVWDCKDVYADEVDDDALLAACNDVHFRLESALDNRVSVDMEDMSKAAYEITNHMYNELSVRLEEWPSSLDAIDFIEAVDHPPIAAFREKMYACGGVGEYNPDAFNELVKHELLTSPDLDDNGVAKLARGGLVSIGQLQQCIGSRGRPTDIDSHIFKDAILAGFATGMDSLTDMLKESRSASLSLYFQKDPMKKSEYFNRNIQLSAASLSKLYYTDCGSRHYIDILISNKNVLRDMNGIAYMDADTGHEKVIRKNSRKLIGKLLKVRSVLTCQHPDREGVCVRCFGELGYSIPIDTNVGHVSSSEMQSKVGQLLLSNKHYLASALLSLLQIQEHDRHFICGGAEENHLYVTDDLSNQGTYQIVVNGKEARNLGDLRDIPNSDTLLPYRVSSLSQIHVMYTADGGPQVARVDCCIGTRNASLSREFLRYIKKVDWKMTDDGDYVIDMTQWDRKLPLLELPLKHFSTLDYMLSIEKFIKGGEVKGKDSMMSFDTLEAALMALHDLVSLKLEVSFSYLQTILLSTMVQSRTDRDYRLPLPRYEGKPAHYRQLMKLRSIAATMAFQEQTTALYATESYILKDRPPHPFDDLVFG